MHFCVIFLFGSSVRIFSRQSDTAFSYLVPDIIQTKKLHDLALQFFYKLFFDTDATPCVVEEHMIVS